jgi:hypothetical protein
MTIIFPSIDTTIFHVPKTGGTFIKEFAAKYKIPHEIIISQAPEESNERLTNSQHTNRYMIGSKRISFVRNPIEWYKSYWYFKIDTKKVNPMNKIDLLWHGNYRVFIEKVAEFFPHGYITEVLKPFFFDQSDLVLQTEKLNQELYNIFQDFDIAQEQIQRFPRSNVRKVDGLIKPGDLRSANRIILDMEQEIFKVYYGPK